MPTTAIALRAKPRALRSDRRRNVEAVAAELARTASVGEVARRTRLARWTVYRIIRAAAAKRAG